MTQTELLNFRIDNESLVKLPKDDETNTGINACTNTELPKNYLDYVVGPQQKNEALRGALGTKAVAWPTVA